MLASAVQTSFVIWGFYAWQPYFQELLHTDAVWFAGVIAAAAAVAVTLRLELPAADAPTAAFAPERAHRTTIFVVPIENHGVSPRLDGLAALHSREGFPMFVEISLQREHTDLHVELYQPRFCSLSSSASLRTSRPGMASSRSTLTSASTLASR